VEFNVFGIPHIFDSVVLTGLSLEAGLSGLHISSFCSGVNDEDDVSFAWPWAIPNFAKSANVVIIIASRIISRDRTLRYASFLRGMN
jgi:hypothetical protein